MIDNLYFSSLIVDRADLIGEGNPSTLDNHLKWVPFDIRSDRANKAEPGGLMTAGKPAGMTETFTPKQSFKKFSN